MNNILDKLINGFEEILDLGSNLIPPILLASLTKMLINIKNKAQESFKSIIFEFIISISLGFSVGYFSFIYFDLDMKLCMCLASLVGWIGSKFKDVIDNYLEKVVKNFKNNSK